MALSNNSRKVKFFIGDRDSEEVELNTPAKKVFVHTMHANSRKVYKQKTKQLKYDKSYEDFANSFTWFVYKVVTFF
jgi:hypothetical protein